MSSEFENVSKDKPCLVCNKPDWCRATEDGAWLICHRCNAESDTPTGFKFVGPTHDGQGGKYVSLDAKPREPLTVEEQVQRDIASAEKRRKAATAADWRLRPAGGKLRVSAAGHRYLAGKGIKAHGLTKDEKNNLLVPMYDIDGKLVNVQEISPDGTKLFLPGGQTKGAFFSLGSPEGASLLVFCEGVATGLSIHEVTGWPVVVCFTSGNLPEVVGLFKDKHPNTELLVCGDDDERTAKESKNGVNPGRKAALKFPGASVLFPPVWKGSEGQNRDFNDMHQALGSDALKSYLCAWKEQAEPPRVAPTLTPEHRLIVSKLAERANKARRTYGTSKNQGLAIQATRTLRAEGVHDDLIHDIVHQLFASPYENVSQDDSDIDWAIKKGMASQIGEGDKYKESVGIEVHKLVGIITRGLKGKLLFDAYGQTRSWYLYGGGIWKQVGSEHIEALIKQYADAEGYVSFPKDLSDVYKLLKVDAAISGCWQSGPSHLLPFQNGVLDMQTGELLAHSPDFRLTWLLPRDHDPSATDWSNIQEYLEVVLDKDDVLIDLVVCFAAAVLHGWIVQKYLHLEGAGGTGKGAITRLLEGLIGKQGVASTSIQAMEGRFGGGVLVGKRLVVLSDQRKLGKNDPDPQTFKNFTGGDSFDVEAKYANGTSKHQPNGLLLMTSNGPVFPGATDSGNQRRVITVPMETRVPKWSDGSMEKKMMAELSAFTNHLLSLDEQTVRAVLLCGAKDSKASEERRIEHMRRNDNVAAWALESLTITPEEESHPVGNDKDSRDSLYGHYYQYALKTGATPARLNDFPERLETCLNGLKVPHKKEKHPMTRRSVFSGVKLCNGIMDTNLGDMKLYNDIKGTNPGDVSQDAFSEGHSEGLKPAQRRKRRARRALYKNY
jgi:P4 family phage/plasmid primase-like protien